VYGPVLRATEMSAHATNHVSCKYGQKFVTAIANFILRASNLEDLAAFMVISSYIFIACAQK